MSESEIRKQAKTCEEICVVCPSWTREDRTLACEGVRVVDRCLLWKKLEVAEADKQKVLAEKEAKIRKLEEQIRDVMPILKELEKILDRDTSMMPLDAQIDKVDFDEKVRELRSKLVPQSTLRSEGHNQERHENEELQTINCYDSRDTIKEKIRKNEKSLRAEK